MIPMAMCGEWPYWGDTWDGFDMVRRPPARALHLAAAPVPLTILRPRRLATPRRDDPAPLARMLAPPALSTYRARFRFRQPSVDTETTAVYTPPPPPPPPPYTTPQKCKYQGCARYCKAQLQAGGNEAGGKEEVGEPTKSAGVGQLL